MIVSDKLKQVIETRFEEVKKLAKNREEALFSVLTDCSADEMICLKYLYAYMPEQDLANYDGALFLKFVRQALKMRKLVPWGEHLKDNLFLNYVLQYRMNNENVEFYTESFFDELFDIVKDKSMHDAVIAVNYWCFSKVTYQSTDIRTASPFTAIRNAYGRCGEESTFNVAALRSVGIPARQIYAPRWAHCDDNHAWTEAWIEGEWHFLGACEPDAVLDTGWFMLPASKGMLIHSRVCSHTVEDEEVVLLTETQTEINVLERYADTKAITVQVKDVKGNVVEGANVRFELANYSELYALTEIATDAKGEAKFLTGYGDLMICVHKDGIHAYEKMDVRKQDTLVVTLPETFVEEPAVQVVSLVPAEGRTPEENNLSEAVKALHQERNQTALQTRRAYEATFFIGEKAMEWAKAFAPYEKEIATALEMSRGNYQEIQNFITDESTKTLLKQKVALMGTLNKKDFSDTSCDTLKAHLVEAVKYEGKYPEEVFVNNVLAPRVLFEMLTPYRAELLEKLDVQTQATFSQNPVEVLTYIDGKIKTAPESTYSTHYSNPVGLLELGYGSDLSKKVLFVAMCRALGIAAHFNSDDNSVAYYKDGQWVNLTFGKEVKKTSKLVLNAQDNTEFAYFRNFTVGKLIKGVYKTLDFENVEWDNQEVVYAVEEGRYRVITSDRHADGTLTLKLHYVNVGEEETVTLGISIEKANGDQGVEVEIPQSSFETLAHEVCQLSDVVKESENIIGYLEVGAEPTEHLLNEILDSQEKFNKLKPNVILVIQQEKDFMNPTLQKVLQVVPHIQVYVGYDKEALHSIYDGFGIQDKKLPLAYVMNQPMKAQNAWAGYNVGIGEMLLKYLN